MSSMPDQRRTAVLQLPPVDVHGTKRNVPCEVECFRGKRLILSTTENIHESMPVSVEYEDTLVLGEVVVCSGADQTWTAEIRVEQILTGLESLMALRAHLLSESLSAPLPLMPVGMRN
jgi:hypothetical protein